MRSAAKWLLAAAGAGVAIWFTSEVLVPRLMTPAAFRSAPELTGLRAIINAEPGEFFGVAASRPDHAAPDPNDPVSQLFARQEAYVLALGHAWRVKAALRLARRAALIGAALIIAGAALFFSATASSRPTYVPVVTTNPAPATPPTVTATATVAPSRSPR